MADIKRTKTGWRIRYGKRAGRKDNRPTVTIGAVSRGEALRSAKNIQHLHECQLLDAEPGQKAREWLKSLDLKIHNRLAKRGLCEYRFEQECRTIEGLTRHFLKWKKSRGLSPASIDVYEKTTKMLVHHFGAGRDISTVSPADMDDFVKWVYDMGNLVDGEYSGPLAPTTASSRCQTAKAIFRRAARKRWISTGDFYEMFEDLPVQVRTNPERQYWVSTEVVVSALEHCLNNEQRLIIALGRWGGIRMPSELLRIEWSDVDRETETIKIRSRKQKNHAHKVLRWIPIWPQIRVYLDIAFDEAREGGSPFVIARYRSSNTSAHSGILRRACRRAGITKNRGESPWPKVWNNMRSTRVTELRQEGYRAGLVNFWMNHEEDISRKHYQQWSNLDWRKELTAE